MTARALDRRSLLHSAIALATVVALAALAAAAAPGSARGLWASPPHPVLAGTPAEILAVLATNLPPLAVPLLLAAALAGQGLAWRTLGDLVTAAVMIANAAIVGAALGAYDTQLAPYLPHLPAELAALACSCSGWWSRRNAPRPLGRLPLLVLALAVLAAGLEVYATPHTGP